MNHSTISEFILEGFDMPIKWVEHDLQEIQNPALRYARNLTVICPEFNFLSRIIRLSLDLISDTLPTD